MVAFIQRVLITEQGPQVYLSTGDLLAGVMNVQANMPFENSTHTIKLECLVLDSITHPSEATNE